MKATNGIGVDVAFDAAGNQAGLDSALLSIRPRGVYLNLAIFDESPQVNMTLVLMREITLTGKFFFFSSHKRSTSRFFWIGTAAYNGIHPEMLEAVASGKIKGMEEFITRKIAIEDLVEKGIMALLHEKDKHSQIPFTLTILHPLMHLNLTVKILVHPWCTEWLLGPYILAAMNMRVS